MIQKTLASPARSYARSTSTVRTAALNTSRRISIGLGGP